MSRIRVTRTGSHRIEKRTLARIQAWLTQSRGTNREYDRLRFVWGFLIGLSSLALGLYHPALAQDEPGRDRQPAPREPERNPDPWHRFPGIRPELDPVDHPLWPDGRRRRGPALRLAAQQDADGPPTQRFDIPAGDLRTALTTYSRQTDLQLLYLAELVEGRQTQGLQGNYTAEEALGSLLSGTGLQYRFSDPKTVVLQRAGRSEEMAPPAPVAAQADDKPVKVQEVLIREKRDLTPAVDSPDGYKADVSSEAVLRFPAPIQELPQSVSVVTKDSIQDRRAVTQQHALEGIAGLTKTAQFGASQPDDFIIRGFRAETNVPGYVRDNGLAAFNNYVGDPTLYERIEVIKGSASFTSGLVTAGGFVNRLLKAPQNENFVVGEVGAGEYGHYRATLDANGVMPTLPALSSRIVMTYNDDAEFFRNTGNQRLSFVPSVRFATSHDFTLTVTGNVQHLRGKGNTGLPTNTFGQIPPGIEHNLHGNDNKLKLDYHSLHVEAEKKFAQGFRLKVKGQYSHDSTSYRYAYAYAPGGIGPNGDFTIYGYGRDWNRESFAGDINLTKDFALLGNLSSLSAGMDFSAGRQLARATDFLSLGDGNIATPHIHIPFPPGFTDPATSFNRDQRFHQTGAFLQGLLRPLAGTTVMLALRQNWVTQQAESGFTGGAGNRRGLNESVVTPQIGLSQRLVEGLNVYASYGESIQPNFALTRDGSLLNPVTGKTIEIGSKWEPLRSRIRLTAAVFRTELDNVATPDPVSPIFFSIGGQSQRNQGFEFEAQGALLPELQVNLAYTFLETEITKSTVADVVGLPAFNVPKHTVSAFGSYDLSKLLTKGLKVGAVFYYRSGVSSFVGPFSAQTYDSYTRADLFAMYAPLKWLSLQVNVNNIFDARFVEGPYFYGAGNHFSPPRHVIGMLRMTF